MRPTLVVSNMKAGKAAEVTQAREKDRTELEVQNTHLAEALRKAEFRIAIEASTARILGLALTRGPLDEDPPEVA